MQASSSDVESLLSTLQECGYHEDYYVAFALDEFQFSNVEAGMDEQLNGL